MELTWRLETQSREQLKRLHRRRMKQLLWSCCLDKRRHHHHRHHHHILSPLATAASVTEHAHTETRQNTFKNQHSYLKTIPHRLTRWNETAWNETSDDVARRCNSVFSERERFAICYCLSVCLSSVCRCNVRTPYSGDWNLRQCFYAMHLVPWPSVTFR